jgi:hypothetical protein
LPEWSSTDVEGSQTDQREGADRRLRALNTRLRVLGIALVVGGVGNLFYSWYYLSFVHEPEFGTVIGDIITVPLSVAAVLAGTVMVMPVASSASPWSRPVSLVHALCWVSGVALFCALFTSSLLFLTCGGAAGALALALKVVRGRQRPGSDSG